MSVSSRSDKSNVYRKNIDTKAVLNTRAHAQADDVLRMQKMIDVKAVNPTACCNTCKHKRKRGLYIVCKQKDMKIVKVYNICYMWEAKP